MIEITCSHCGRKYHTEEEHLGKAIRCVTCNKVILLLQPKEPIPPAEIDFERPGAPSADFRYKGPPPPRSVQKLSPSAAIGISAVILACIIAFFAGMNSRPASPISSASAPVSGASPASSESAASPTASASPNVRWDDESNTEPTKRSVRPPKASKKLPAADGDVIDQLSAERGSFARPSSSEPVTSRRHISLPTGTRIAPDSEVQGRGELVLRNGNAVDAAVRVLERQSEETVRWVYVRAGEDLSLKGIPPGSYVVLWTLGADWDNASRRFRRRAVYERTDKSLSFDERRTSDGLEYLEYSEYTLTLYPVARGNTPYHEISEAEFYRGFKPRPFDQ